MKENIEEPIRWQPSERKGPITLEYVAQTLSYGFREFAMVFQTPVSAVRSELIDGNSSQSPHIH